MQGIKVLTFSKKKKKKRKRKDKGRIKRLKNKRIWLKFLPKDIPLKNKRTRL
jgi:hypothetical protein